MSWQAFEAIRDHSESRGAARTVGFVLASYADEHGGNIFPSLDTIGRKAKVARKTAVDARRWFLDSGEAVQEGERRSGTPSMSLAPLIARGSVRERVQPVHPDEKGGFSHSTPGVQPVHPGGSIYADLSSARKPEPEVKPSVRSSNKSSVDQSPFLQQNSEQRAPATAQAAREEQQRPHVAAALAHDGELGEILDSWKRELPRLSGPKVDKAYKAIADLESQRDSLALAGIA
jgi:hypothetical protein